MPTFLISVHRVFMKTNSQILSVLEYMEKEKGISRSAMIETISEAIRAAALKSINSGHDLRVEINPRTGELKAWAIFEVVDFVSDPSKQVHISKALATDDTAEIGTVIEKEIDPALLGRIAAQTARQAITQKVRSFEREKVYEDFKNRIGDLVTGTVRRVDHGNVFVDIGNVEAVMPARETIFGEEHNVGDRVRCLLLAINSDEGEAELILSRSHVNFVKRLLEIEISEIQDGAVEIKGIAREPGYRTKICVDSNDKDIDPVGACVGARGARIKSVVKEMNGEKVDVIRYYEDPKRLLQEAIKPAIATNIRIDEGERRIYFEVADSDLAIAIGKRGINARLTSRMMNWRLDISKEEVASDNFGDKLERAVAGLNDVDGISDEMAQRLVAIGITCLDAFDGVEKSDLVDAGFNEDEANQILNSVKKVLKD